MLILLLLWGESPEGGAASTSDGWLKLICAGGIPQGLSPVPLIESLQDRYPAPGRSI